MKSPIKRPVTLSNKNVYIIKKGAMIKYTRWSNPIKLKEPLKVVFDCKGYYTNYAYFRKPRTKHQTLIVLHWNRNVKFLRHKKTDE